MAEIFALCAVLLVAATGAAFLVHYFWQIPFSRSFACAGFFVLMFIIFWASGLWVGASRHSWGVLTPVFAAIIVGCWLGFRFGPALLKKFSSKIMEKDKRD